jgi:hypothetical protein
VKCFTQVLGEYKKPCHKTMPHGCGRLVYRSISAVNIQIRCTEKGSTMNKNNFLVYLLRRRKARGVRHVGMDVMISEPEEHISLGRHGYRWEYNIKMNLKEIRCEDVGWIHPDQDGVL